MVAKTRNRFTIVCIVLTIAAIASVAAFAQAPEAIQIAANTTPPAASKPAGELAPSTVALQARIDAQQQEIARLSALVEKLQASLQPIASTQPVLPTVNMALLTGGGMPAGSPAPAPAPVVATSSTPRELLPDIGHIGAELGFFVGGATNPYKDDKGFASGGYIDLPWKNVPGGKLSYEIMIGLQRATTTQTTTSGVNVLVNAALNSYLGNVGPGTTPTQFLAGPLPITSTVQERSKVLTVAPFELKYAITKMGRFRPYVVGGLGAYVWIGSDNNAQTFDANKALGSLASAPVGTSTLGATLNALLQGSQIGGLVPTAPQLAARGVPHGQGNLLFGGQVGGGFEIRVTPKLSMGADFRRNQVEGSNASFNTFAFKQGLHW
jgi:hypothetical protein